MISVLVALVVWLLFVLYVVLARTFFGLLVLLWRLAP